MQDFFFVGIICAIALGVLIFKSIFFVIHLVNLKTSNDIIGKNLKRHRLENQRVQQIQKTINSIENVVDWRMDDPRLLNEDLRQQFLTKTKARRTTTSDRASPRDKVPLATTDFENASDSEQLDNVPIYHFNPIIGGTQV